MATQVSYNGIRLGLVTSVKVSQKSEYDSSNTDVIWIANRFTVRSVLSLAIGAEGPSIGAEAPAATMARIRHMLLQPRKKFVYSSSDAAGVANLLTADGDTDSNNGPKPVECEITKVSERTWIIDYTIDVAVRDCDGAGFQLFASNRYETTHEIDHKGYSTITTLGKVVVRSDMKKSPDSLRWVVTPPLPKGFKRKSMYQVQEDGLAMLYRIIDTEMYLAPPINAVEATGRFTITAIPPGAIMWAQVDVHLEGRKTQPKRQLMETAILIALRRLEAGGAMLDPIKGKPFVEGGSLGEELFDNSVSVQLRARFLPGQRIVKEGDQFNFFYGFWKGFLAGVAGPGAAGGAGAQGGDATAKAWRDAGGLIGGASPQRGQVAPNPSGLAAPTQAARDATIRATNGAAGDRQSPDPMEKRRGPGDKPAAGDAQRAPPAVNGTLDSSVIDRFGVVLDGCDQDGTVDPGLSGNMHFMLMVGAAFRDPCVVDFLANLQNGSNLPFHNHLQGGAVGNVVAGRGVSDEAVFEEVAFQDTDATWNAAHTSRLQSAGGRTAQPNPSLDWRNGRLTNITVEPGDASGLRLREVRVLPEDFKPAPPADPFPGWYEAWYCEVGHEFDTFACALPASMAGKTAVSCKYANTLRTVRIKWSATKADWPPELPMIIGDPNTVLLAHKMQLPTIEIAADGKTPIFTCNGETVYQLLDETYALAAYPIPPWLNLPMRAMPGPIPSPTISVSGGPAGLAQDAALAAIRAGVANNQAVGA